MIICCYAELNKAWNNDELEKKAALLPVQLKQKIFRKIKMHDVQLSVGGNLLVLSVLKHFGLSLSLADILYNACHRPYFDAGFDFNVAHSGNMVVCCGTINGKVGIDTEFIVPVNFNYDDYFTANEQKNIRADHDPQTAFFKFWTRKESLLKAFGTGFFTPLQTVDVSNNSFAYNNETYHLSSIQINPDYQSCIAHTVKQEINIEKVALW